MSTMTLRARYQLAAPTSLDPATSALLLVDFQHEFFGGALPIPDGAAAVAHAARLLRWARTHGLAVVHVRQVAARSDSPLFAPGSPAIAIVPALAPESGEPVVAKAMAGAFTRTELDAMLRARGVTTLVIAGLMTHLAVDCSARDAAVLGYRVIVASDATATRDLRLGDDVLDRATVQRVALAALADRFADVMTSDAIVELPISGT